MKCEICQQRDAEVAIEKDEEELYVCKPCAERERMQHQTQRNRTRKIMLNGRELEAGEEPPPILGAIINAFEGIAGEIEKASGAALNPPKDPDWKYLPCERAPRLYRIGGRLHLEGLHLIGELEAVKRAARALELDIRGVEADGIRDAGHVFLVGHTGQSEKARRFVEDLLREEKNARVRLREEMTRVFGDALCRALAILKNCRMLSPGELFDLLSPIRLAAIERMLDGITLAEINELMTDIDLNSREDALEPLERDRIDGERADEMNERFMQVMLNERAEGQFL